MAKKQKQTWLNSLSRIWKFLKKDRDIRLLVTSVFQVGISGFHIIVRAGKGIWRAFVPARAKKAYTDTRESIVAKIKDLKKTRYYKWIVISGGTMLLMVLVFLMQTVGPMFQASLIGLQQQAPFDGLTMPVTKTLDWSSMTGDDYDRFRSGELTYNNAGSKLVALPAYNTSTLSVDPTTLGWNSADNAKRNTLLTFITAYMGKYTMGSEPAIENTGSHLAIDIRAPKGTPVYAIGNGEVTKTKSSDGTIVIKHTNFPSPTDESLTHTYHSSYLHLDTIAVSVGDIVTKGQYIGTVGKKGFASTHHLHFQIDNDDAPWHPYWPFTWSEAQSAGYDFVSGIDNGLGKSSAAAYSIHPISYVYKYLNYSGGSSDSNDDSPDDTDTNDTPDTNNDDSSGTDDTSDTDDTSGTDDNDTLDTADTPDTGEPIDSFSFSLDEGTFIKVNGKEKVTITAVDSNGETIANPQLSGTINGSLTEDIGSLNDNSLQESDFSNGSVEVTIDAAVEGRAQIALEYNGTTYYSNNFEVIEEMKMVDSLRLVTDGLFVINSPVNITLYTLDVDGDVTPRHGRGTVSFELLEGSGTFSPTSVDLADFEDGQYTVSFTATSEDPIQIRAQSGSILGDSDRMYPALFNDLSASHPNYEAIVYLKNQDVINGYPDGSFKPNNTVSRVESLKFILAGIKKQLLPGTGLVYKDTFESEWYAPYVATATSENIVQGYPDLTFKPANTVNRAEFFKILLLSMGVNIPSSVSSAPYPDVPTDSWYAPYVTYVKDKNLLDVSGNFNASQGMSRAEVAEAMFRVMVLKQNGNL